MAKICQVSFYAVDPVGDLDIESVINYAKTRDCFSVEQLHVRESKSFEWEDDLPVNYKNCDLKALEAYFDHDSEMRHDASDVVIGGTYRHFKGEVVKVIAVSKDTEYGQLSVVYEYEPTHTVWNRPLDMFLSEVDHEKYPDVKQKMRFELIDE